MVLLLIVLGFLIPVVMVFAYSVWLNRRQRERNAQKMNSETNGETSNDSE